MDCEPRLNFVSWYLYGVHAEETNHTLILSSDEAWFHIRGNVNSQNNQLPM